MTTINSAMAPRIAIIEDDPDLRDTMVDYLQSEGYPAWGVESAEFFYRRYAVEKIDIVIVDIGLPGEDGLSVTAHLHGLPELAVIIVSARGTLDDRLAGLRAGADRYLVKPVDFAELLANIEACASRSGSSVERTKSNGIWSLKKEARRLVDPEGKAIALTSREFYFLLYLFEANGEAVARKTMAKKVIGPQVVNGSERLDVLLARLRKKGQSMFGKPLPIMTVHQIGFAFTAPLQIE